MFGRKYICRERGSQNVRVMKYEAGQYECRKEGCTLDRVQEKEVETKEEGE